MAEELDHRLLGTIFHQSTQSLYQTFPDGEITAEGLDALTKNDSLIEQHIQTAYESYTTRLCPKCWKAGPMTLYYLS